MKGLLLSVALLAVASEARADPVILDAKVVFPGNDGADAATLDRPLAERLAEVAKGKKKLRKRIVVHKAQRRMDVYADDVLLKSYVVNLGFAPEGNKGWEGDGKTPEGDLYICSVNKVSQFTRFLALAYPTPTDARRGADAGRIDPSTARAIEAAWKTGTRCPPQTSKLGGMVGIHGKGSWVRQGDRFAVVDWTLGCIGLRDADILELFEGYAEVGVPVHIAP